MNTNNWSGVNSEQSVTTTITDSLSPGVSKLLPVLKILIFASLLFAILTSTSRASGQIKPNVQDPVPVMAYYYIWYDTQSWNRAKSDYPLLGRYSSDDRAILEQHVRWAKDAGIDGFIVSWKSTFQLDSRLEQLMEVAAAEDFYLWIIYQGLDFDRYPLPTSQIEADLEYFIDQYAHHPAFSMYDRPVVIWSGTWEFSPQEIDEVTAGYRDQLYLLASEQNLAGYQRLAHLVDGNAYYWSSVNPDVNSRYQEKLDAMGQAVHDHGGLWVAPAAPGFDARLIGGTRVIERKNGDTLRREMDAALRSSPDAIGLISWNEFSENTHIEPSQNYGTRALAVLADMQQGMAPQVLDFDSSAPGTTDHSDFYTLYILGGLFVFITTSVIFVIMRSKGGYNQTINRTNEVGIDL